MMPVVKFLTSPTRVATGRMEPARGASVAFRLL